MNVNNRARSRRYSTSDSESLIPNQSTPMLNVDEFTKLSSRDVPRAEVCNRLMQRLAEATGADAAVLWSCAEEKFRPISKHLVEPTFQLKMTEADHAKMLSQVVNSRRSILLRPEQAQTGGGQTNQKPAPMILLAPLQNPSYEVIELIVPCGNDSAPDKELMSTLEQAVEIASVAPGEAPIQSARLKDVDVVSLSQYVHGIHASLEKRTTTSNIANETRLLLDCDRVVVVAKERGRFKISSISGQPSVNRRSNTVRLLEKLAGLILKTEKDFWYPTTDELPRQLKSVIDEYTLISATRSLVIKPIFEKPEKHVEDPETNESTANRVIGGLIFEHCNEQWEQKKVSGVLSFVHGHASNALRNATRHNGLFLYPLWNLLGKSRILAAPRILPKALMVLAALILATLLLIFWRTPFYVSADGVFVPQKRAWVYAGQQGDIEEVLVEHGAKVEKEQPLAKLANRQLELSLIHI